MLNNHVAEYQEITTECFECHGTGALRFEDMEECIDYCEATFYQCDVEPAIREYELNGEIQCRECAGTGHVTERR